MTFDVTLNGSTLGEQCGSRRFFFITPDFFSFVVFCVVISTAKILQKRGDIIKSFGNFLRLRVQPTTPLPPARNYSLRMFLTKAQAADDV